MASMPDRRLLRKMMSRGVPRVEAALLPNRGGFRPPTTRAALRITPDSAERSKLRVREIFEEVDERMREGRRYLVGHRFTAADLTFAALASPMLLPAGCGAAHPVLDKVPPAKREEVRGLRDNEAGRFVLRLYSEERVRAPRGA
jgi:glutathione S-transferase